VLIEISLFQASVSRKSVTALPLRQMLLHRTVSTVGVTDEEPRAPVQKIVERASNGVIQARRASRAAEEDRVHSCHSGERSGR